MNADSMYEQARSLFQSHQYEDALRKLKELVSQSNLAHKIHAMIADCYLESHQFEMAILSLKQVNSTRPDATRLDSSECCSQDTFFSLIIECLTCYFIFSCLEM